MITRDHALYYSIKPTYSVSYYRRHNTLPREGFSGEKHNTPQGYINPRAATKIKNAVNWLVCFSDYKEVYSKSTGKSYKFLLNFITLTLSGKQEHSDQFIKEHMLYPFIKWMKRQGAHLYLWKAETQKNGNIHFHITTNQFLHWKSIRKKWNSLQGKHGYLKSFTEGNVRGDPNSTDVHAVIKTEQIGKYMVKYMLKNQPDRRLIQGRLWACSPELSRIRVQFNAEDESNKTAVEHIHRNTEYKRLDYTGLYINLSDSTWFLDNDIIEKLVRNEWRKIQHKLPTQKRFTIE